jgi:hypothetical protein
MQKEQLAPLTVETVQKKLAQNREALERLRTVPKESPEIAAALGKAIRLRVENDTLRWVLELLSADAGLKQ